MMFGVIELKSGGGGLNKSDNQGTLSTGHAYTFLPPLPTTPPFLFNITPLPLSPPPPPIPALPATDQFLHCIATLLLQNARVSYRPVCSLSPSTLNAVRVCTIHVYIILYYIQYIIMYNLKGISHCHGLRLQLPLATRRVARARCVGHRREDKLRTAVIIL